MVLLACVQWRGWWGRQQPLRQHRTQDSLLPFVCCSRTTGLCCVATPSTVVAHTPGPLLRFTPAAVVVGVPALATEVTHNCCTRVSRVASLTTAATERLVARAVPSTAGAGVVVGDVVGGASSSSPVAVVGSSNGGGDGGGSGGGGGGRRVGCGAGVSGGISGRRAGEGICVGRALGRGVRNGHRPVCPVREIRDLPQPTRFV